MRSHTPLHLLPMLLIVTTKSIAIILIIISEITTIFPPVQSFMLKRTAISATIAKKTTAIMSLSTSTTTSQLQYIDAGANLLDSMYQGTYHLKSRHEPDLDIVLQRAYNKGVHTVISLAGTINESIELMELIENLDSNSKKENRIKVFGTVGVHPTRCAEVFAEKEASANASWKPKSAQIQNEIIQQLIDLATKGKENIIAIGECGLDYARLQFCPKDIQKLGLHAQLEVAYQTNLPLYLHNRESGDDLYEILSEYNEKLGSEGSHIRGIVHSFDEGIEICMKLMSLGLYIGINGCSLKTAENLEVVKDIPLDRLILETDCPWCDIRPTHASMQYVTTTFPTKKEKKYTRELGKEFCVKNRTEPCREYEPFLFLLLFHFVLPGANIHSSSYRCCANSGGNCWNQGYRCRRGCECVLSKCLRFIW